MIVVGKKLLFEYLRKNVNAKAALSAWVTEAERACWKTPQDIKKRYSTASFLHGNLVVFNIKGNNYRLVVVVLYEEEIVRIKWIGTHSEYDRQKF
ncbi:MAG TPA: type II toxin-antitoxin system HigB family toxin [bacterium]|jgi:mRNA interferase HigB|nr:type II toxin-antitoxin system HigB family toxin [bacterium]HOB71761.1 type II toxin-antitoxin system HigB family toxin [bacterium]HOG44282.1 type II toxin-antitoxin system HigB family toxin [bacterium]HPM46401.1 type II toxin-antitoxin system HigB family toxin [bacterium]HPV20517.1 type II toxin-antitoxin system HigB family toxin [bacterium]